MQSRSRATEWKKDASGLLEKRAFEKKWYAYAVAGAGAILAAPSAHASVVYSGVQNLNASVSCDTNTTCPLTSGQLIVDLDLPGTDGQFKLSATAVSSSATLLNFFQGATADDAAAFRNGVNNTPLFAANASIGPGGATSFISANHPINPSATWGNANGFMGLQFHFSGDANGGDVNYAWAHIITTASLVGTTETYNLTVVDWAYENNANTAIQAGATSGGGAAPEPGTAGLSLLALGAAGLAAWRKRKLAATKQSA